jgi:hypothetical protein
VPKARKKSCRRRARNRAEGAQEIVPKARKKVVPKARKKVVPKARKKEGACPGP